MNPQTHQNYVEVLDVLITRKEILAHIKVLSGNVEADMILEEEETGAQWRIVVFGLIHWVIRPQEDIRGVLLEALPSNQVEIRPGMHLYVRNQTLVFSSPYGVDLGSPPHL